MECAEILKNSYFSLKLLFAASEDDILDENRKKRGCIYGRAAEEKTADHAGKEKKTETDDSTYHLCVYRLRSGTWYPDFGGEDQELLF
jgi:hypothetical protein